MFMSIYMWNFHIDIYVYYKYIIMIIHVVGENDSKHCDLRMISDASLMICDLPVCFSLSSCDSYYSVCHLYYSVWINNNCNKMIIHHHHHHDHHYHHHQHNHHHHHHHQPGNSFHSSCGQQNVSAARLPNIELQRLPGRLRWVRPLVHWVVPKFRGGKELVWLGRNPRYHDEC